MSDETASTGPRMLGETREVFLARVLLHVLRLLCEKDSDQRFLTLYDSVKGECERCLRKGGRKRPDRRAV